MVDAQQRVDFNWNDGYRTNGMLFYHLTDFCLTQVAPDGDSRSITSLLLANPGNPKQKYTLSGNLISRGEPFIRKPFRVSVNSYYIDVGSSGSAVLEDPLRGFWMVGEDEDVRYKLVYPPAPEYMMYARILELATYSNLFGFYSHKHETGRCVRMTDFILTDKESGSKQTLILPKFTKRVSVLKGTIIINPKRLAETNLDAFIGNTDKARCARLPLQTYINSTYVVDFGMSNDTNTVPIFRVEDLYKTWLKLEPACHPEYLSDYNIAMSRTINNVAAYNWDADGNEVWRHVTNFRLTTLTGQLHELEITSEESVFILWGDLQPPSGSACPPIPVKLYVTTSSVDTGTERHDVNMGVWMQEMKGSWYKLDLPAAPDYKEFAEPMFENARKFLELFDALFYQDEDGDQWCPSDPESDKVLLKWPIKNIHRACNPKFDLKWVARNKDFVYRYLANDINLPNSLVFIESVEALGNDIHVDAPAGHHAHRAAEKHSNGTSTGKDKQHAVQKAVKEKSVERSTDSKAVEKAQAAPIAAVSSVARAAVLSSGLSSSASHAEPASQGKKRPLETEARAEKVAKLLAGGSTSGSKSGDAQKKNGIMDPATTAAPAPVAAKPIKKKQIFDLDTLAPVPDRPSAPSVANRVEPQPISSNNNPAANAVKRPRLEIPARPPTTKPMPASFYNNVAPGVPIRPVEPLKRPPPPSSSAAPPATIPPPPPMPMQAQTVGNSSPRPFGAGNNVGSATSVTSAPPGASLDRSHFASSPFHNSNNSDEVVRQPAPLHPDAHRRSASRESDYRDQPPYSYAEDRSWAGSGVRQPSEDRHYPPVARDNRSQNYESSSDRRINAIASGLDPRPSEPPKHRGWQELVEGESFCEYCRGVTKLSSCYNDKHVHGQRLLIYRLKDLGRDEPGRVNRETSRSLSSERDTRHGWNQNDNREIYGSGPRWEQREGGEKRARSDSRERNDPGADSCDLCSFCRSKLKKANCRNNRHVDGLYMQHFRKHVYEAPRSDEFSNGRDSNSAARDANAYQSKSALNTGNDRENSNSGLSSAPSDGAGRGRGRNSTLPAWMTAQSATNPIEGVSSSNANILAQTTAPGDGGQFADPPYSSETQSKIGTAAGDGQGDDNTLVDSEAELNSLLGVSSDEEGEPSARRVGTTAQSADVTSKTAVEASIRNSPPVDTASVTTSGSQGIVAHNNRKVRAQESDTESGEVTEDSEAEAALPPPPQPTQVPSVHKISAFSMMSQPPPKQSRFAHDGSFRVTPAVMPVIAPLKEHSEPVAGQTMHLAPPPPQLTVPLPIPTAVVVNNVKDLPAAAPKATPVSMSTAPQSATTIAAPAPKASRFVTDGSFKVTPMLPVSAGSNVVATAPAARSTLSILNAAVAAAAASPRATTSDAPSVDKPAAAHVANASAAQAQQTTPVPVVSLIASSAPSTTTSGGSFSSPIIILDNENSTNLSKRVVVKDEMSIERSKYVKKQHSPVAATGDDSSAPVTFQLTLSRPTTSIGGKWGTLTAKPSSASPRPIDGTTTSSSGAGASAGTGTAAHGSTAEVVRLGVREDDPKKRLAMNNRHAGGVFTQGSSGAAASASPRGNNGGYGASSLDAAPVYSDETSIVPAIINLKAMPIKSALRAESGAASNKSTSSIAPAGNKDGAVKRVVWRDSVEGGQIRSVRLIEKAVYVNELEEEAPSVILLPFSPDAEGCIKVQWNDGDAQSP